MKGRRVNCDGVEKVMKNVFEGLEKERFEERVSGCLMGGEEVMGVRDGLYNIDLGENGEVVGKGEYGLKFEEVF